MSPPLAEVIGDPISHSRSPLIHGFWLGKLGILGDYRTCHLRPGELGAYFSARRADPAWRGCNVTVPHKEAVAPFLDAVDERARTVGAVNTVLRAADGTLTGTNTDIDGIAEAVGAVDLGGRSVCVIGAGGAARAAFQFLAERRCGPVRVLARRPDEAQRVAGEFALDASGIALAPGSGALRGAALLINATQLGMAGQQPMPGFVLDELDELAGDALVFDMVYAPLRTALLETAETLGRRRANGLAMLVGQAAAAFEKFFGAPAPRQHDAELRALLTA